MAYNEMVQSALQEIVTAFPGVATHVTVSGQFQIYQNPRQAQVCLPHTRGRGNFPAGNPGRARTPSQEHDKSRTAS